VERRLKGRALRLFPGLASCLTRLKAAPAASRLARGTFWSLVGTVLGRGLSVLASIFVARQLGKLDFGALGMVQSTMLNFSVFIGCGLGVTATKHLPEFRVSDPARAGRVVALSGVAALLVGGVLSLSLAAAAPWIAERVLAAPRLSGLVRIGALLLFLNTLNGSQTGALAGFEAFKSIARVNLWSGLISFPLVVGAVLAGGLAGGVWGLVAAAAVNWLLSQQALRRECRKFGIPPGIAGISKEWREFAAFALPSILGGIVLGPVNWLCSTILVNQPGGYAEMGVFSATGQWFALVLFLPGLLSQVLLPILSETMHSGERGKVSGLMKLALAANAAAVVPCILLLSLASPWLMSLYGRGFEKSWLVLVVSLVTGAIYALQSPANQLLNAKGLVWILLLSNLLWGGLFTALTWAFIEHGALGMVTARLVAYLAQSLFILWVVLHQDRAATTVTACEA
jgi:O-antigen/teichoic acid export membrane protein